MDNSDEVAVATDAFILNPRGPKRVVALGNHATIEFRGEHIKLDPPKGDGDTFVVTVGPDGEMTGRTKDDAHD